MTRETFGRTIGALQETRAERGVALNYSARDFPADCDTLDRLRSARD